MINPQNDGKYLIHRRLDEDLQLRYGGFLKWGIPKSPMVSTLSHGLLTGMIWATSMTWETSVWKVVPSRPGWYAASAEPLRWFWAFVVGTIPGKIAFGVGKYHVLIVTLRFCSRNQLPSSWNGHGHFKNHWEMWGHESKENKSRIT